MRERVGVFYARRASEGTQILQIKAALARLWWRQQRYGRLRTFIHERLPGGPDLLRSTTIRTYVLCSHWLSGSTGQPPWSWGLGLSTTWGTHEAAAEAVEARPAEHLALQPREAVDRPLDGARTPGDGDAGVDRSLIRGEPSREAA